MVRRLSATELYNATLEAFHRAEIDEAVALLRSALFENLYIAPALLGEDWEPRAMWTDEGESSPESAELYVERYGRAWHEAPDSLLFLDEVWSDASVRGELQNFIKLSKALLQCGDERQRQDLHEARERFLDERRIRHTQGEILERLRAGHRVAPVEPPRVALLLLASRDPEASIEFYRKLLGVEPDRTSRLAGGYAEFRLPGLQLAIHGHDRLADGDPYGLGPPPASLGWGAVLVLRVRDFNERLARARAEELEIVDCEDRLDEARFFVVRDPSGYVVELSEEDDPRGLGAV